MYPIHSLVIGYYSGGVKLWRCWYRFHPNPLTFQRLNPKHGSSQSAGLTSKNLTDRKRAQPPRQVSQLILDHFDAQYSEELGDLWSSARAVLLTPQCWQYGVMLNRFSELDDLEQRLEALGFCHLPPCAAPDPRSQAPPGGPDPHGPLRFLIHRDPVRLRGQRHRPGWLKQYYLLNAASLLPVLSLGVRDGDRVLDLCSAPGGKALAILQTAVPELLHCNESDGHRHAWLTKTLQSFVPATLGHIVTVTNQDGRLIGSESPGAYDKVLVDAPCSNDRSWLYTPHDHRGALWIKERARLPWLQAELLCSALAAVRPGGVVVYSTCTLSRAENQGVVEAVLKSRPEVELMDLESELIGRFSDHFTFAQNQARLGVLVVPGQGRTWGPMFVSRFRRIC